MDRAEELAMLQYPVPKDNILANSVRNAQRAAFQLGYLTAAEDLALTWEDVRTILDKENDILRECNDNAQQVIEVYPKGEDYYGEILKRFNEQRKK